MSIAGIRSRRGNNYETLIALDWALTVISDPDYLWLEIDSVNYAVDDIVIGKSDGSLICCQCKKNQTDFKAWSLSDLGDELDKAFLALVSNPQVLVRFYSRSEFGAISKLREFSVIFDNQADYHENITKEHTKTDSDLADRIINQNINFSTFEFLKRTSFEISPDLDRIETLLNERLRRMASNASAAFNALCGCLNKLSGRMGNGSTSATAQHRLTKDDLKEALRLAAIDDRKRSVLLTGLPGSGKTCVMLSLQGALEQRTQNDLIPLFIQSREFADMATVRERKAQGLPEEWVGQAARLAEDSHIVVVIDSLDVLSIAREHSVLTYFLAQIDQLLLIPNITVITACRDFDRKYDRRIATRQWDCELKCEPLNWKLEIVPLLNKLGIESSTIDTTTRELIQNPRELALFVELAQHEGSFNVVTSQALAQRYLNTIVKTDTALGDEAIKAIENIADTMLKSRSLSIPSQRFSASPDILRRLKSLNVLQETHDEKLTFGHQTLLDVLVISRAMRQGVSLQAFIQGLPPVPFVRPSIRSFVSQLASGDRRGYRRQLRTVLSGNTAFHIRRLVAESFAQQVPENDDWPLIRDLRNKHREVFQVIYSQAFSIEWHYFWLSYLVPELKEARDAEGLTSHVHRVAQWKNEDASGVLAFWMNALSLDWLSGNEVSEQLKLYLSDFTLENLPLIVPLLEWLLKMPSHEHSFFGGTVARCVDAGAIDDELLWCYITGGISENSIIEFRLGTKLNCKPHEFGDKNDNFLVKRMLQSTDLLDLALESIEQWSQSTRYGGTRIGYRHGFLGYTSYNDIHTQTDNQHIDSERVLLDAIEAAILDHAKKHSEWWLGNRERLCFNHEGALCYFSVLALTSFPKSNLDLISRLLCDRNLLEFELSFEIAKLTQSVFPYLNTAAQDAVMETMLTIWEEQEAVKETSFWALKKRAEYISAIPVYLRSEKAQATLDAYERIDGLLIRQPKIGMRGGYVTAPFTFGVFLSVSNDGIIRLLKHYSGYHHDYDDFLVGGEQEVGGQLREASSRHPLRFLDLLRDNWKDIPAHFSDDLMDGIANYLERRHGNSQANGDWEPIKETNASVLVNRVLDELEKHSAHWQLNRSAAKALKACAYAISDTQSAERLTSLAVDFEKFKEKNRITGDSVDLLTTGINMVIGNISEALMITASNLQEHGILLPELLSSALRQFASNKDPAIRALMLQRLPYFQSQNPQLGWELFDLSMRDASGLWRFAERCLYYTYHKYFERVAPLLERIYGDGTEEDMKTWGRISALSALSGHTNFADFLEKLKALNITEAWQGAANVWTNTGNIRQYREQCLKGIEACLMSGSSHSCVVARQVDNIFRKNEAPISLPINLIELCFIALENDSENKRNDLVGFSEWLSKISLRDPELALAAAEIYLAYISRAKTYYYDHENRLVQLISRLFGEAEEREEADNGEMLKRVVSVQDALLSLGVNSMSEWLKAAERQ